MRERTYETMIEIPLREYERLVREWAENRIYLTQRSEENFSKTLELKETKDRLSELSEAYEQVVEELERYKRLYDKEDK